MLIDFNGNLYASTHNSGVMKSIDGGETWRKVLGIEVGNSNSDRGADLEIGPDGDLYATTGLFSLGSVHKVNFEEHGPVAGDIETWIDITPNEEYRRMEIAVALTDSSRVYLLCEHEEDRTVDGMFRSDNGGLTWDSIPIPTLTITSDTTNFARKQAWYNLIAKVDPDNKDVVYVGGIDLHRSDDGGESWIPLSNWYASASDGFVEKRVVHADQHEIQFINGDPSQAIFTNDGGIYYSDNLGAAEPSFIPKDQGYNTTQFYSCCMPPAAVDQIYAGGTQDNGTWLVFGDELDPDMTLAAFGGDGGYCFWGTNQTPDNCCIFSVYRISLFE